MFTRDSRLWTIVYTVGLAMAAGLVAGNAADYGLSPVQFKWAQLMATGLVAAGKFGNSPLPSSADVKQDAKDLKAGQALRADADAE